MTDSRTWQKHEITLTAEREWADPYREVEVWVDLEGPDFAARVFGFWDGGRIFRVRIMAPSPGSWRWVSGSAPDDPGLSGRSGTLEVTVWSEAEKAENPLRRGMIGPTPDGRALQHADGTPFFLLGDTWWSLPSFRFPLAEPDAPQPVGPGATLNDLAHHRRAQGFTCIALLAAQPAWANDGHPPQIRLDDGTWVRAAWRQPGTESAKDMHNEGGRPFEFPGRVPGLEDVVPDLDRINPAYFQVLDRKIDYLNGLGLVPFIEASRRDIGPVWQRFHDWPESYARYVQYVFARYQAHIAILSPIHYDYYEQTIPACDYNAPIALMLKRWGRPPFGSMLSANPNPSTLVNFGGTDEAPWLDLHQSGNLREHHAYWHLTEIHRAEPPKPAIAGEPYYAGLHQLGTPYPLRAEPDSDRDLAQVRSGLYGSFLSGALGGVIYGAEGIWQADTEEESLYPMWRSFLWRSGDEVRHLRTFAEGCGGRYRELVPEAELVVPNKSGPVVGYTGWAFAAATPGKDLILVYFEPQAPQEAHLRSLRPGDVYRSRWFDPREGEWGAWSAEAAVERGAVLRLPPRPDDRDWGLQLEQR